MFEFSLYNMRAYFWADCASRRGSDGAEQRSIVSFGDGRLTPGNRDKQRGGAWLQAPDAENVCIGIWKIPFLPDWIILRDKIPPDYQEVAERSVAYALISYRWFCKTGRSICLFWTVACHKSQLNPGEKSRPITYSPHRPYCQGNVISPTRQLQVVFCITNLVIF